MNKLYSAQFTINSQCAISKGRKVIYENLWLHIVEIYGSNGYNLSNVQRRI